VNFGHDTSGFVFRFKGHATVRDGETASGYGEQLQIQAPPYPRVIRSKTYRVYVKPRIISNSMYEYNVIEGDIRVTAVFLNFCKTAAR